MKMRIWPTVNFIAGLVMIGSAKIWAPVCDGLLTLDTGKQVHMKCFYAGQALILLGIVIAVIAVLSMAAKKDYRLIQVSSIVVALLVFLIFSDSFIGVCAKVMACHATKRWAFSMAVVSIAASAIDIISGNKEGQIPD